MSSDSDYDSFDYNSSQDYSEIDYQIDLFESRHWLKFKKQSKQKIKKPSCPISVKTLQLQPTLVKLNCMSYKKTAKAERKSFRYDGYPPKSTLFECDEQFQTKSTSDQPNVPLNSSKKLATEHLQNFSNFRRHFYHVNHQLIKSSFEDHPNIKITDIRLATVNEFVQNDFMKRLNENASDFPHLVYPIGTTLQSIESILRYGFLIPNQAHPTNTEAPSIVPKCGQSYGTGIQCSQTAIYSLSYVNTTNTLLVCAAIPKRDKTGKVECSYGNILVLSHVSRIISLFLLDFIYLSPLNANRSWFNMQTELKVDDTKKIKKPDVIPRKYLRKVLNFMNDQVRNNSQYQARMFDSFN